MRIACLGWGSLIWDPRDLPIRREWFKDGPFAPVEFTRESSDGRITLVIDSASTPIRLLWAHMIPTDLEKAKEALRIREGTSESKIGSCETTKATEEPKHIDNLPEWVKAHGLDAVIWTALPSKFNKKEEERPSVDQVIDYLRTLEGGCRDCAKEYIERTPRQIDTDYRRKIEAALGWSCKE